MKIDGSTVHYMLSQVFNNVTSYGVSRVTTFDYPLLYDVSGDMRGHTVLVPDHERPFASPTMESVLCVCMGAASAKAAREAGFPVVLIGDEVTFQHLYNVMQSIFVSNDRMEAQLRAYVATHAGFLPLLDACSRTLGLSCLLVDDQYRVVCQTSAPFQAARTSGAAFQMARAAGRASQGTDAAGYEAKDGMLDTEVVDLFMASRDYRYMRASRSVFTVPGSSTLLMKNIFKGDKLVATLIIRHKGDVLSARFVWFTLNYLSPFVEEMYARIGSFEAMETARAHVGSAIRNVLAGEAQGYVQLEAALEESGFGRESQYVVVRVERSFTHEGAVEGGYLARRFETALPQSFGFLSDGHLFLLAASSRSADASAGSNSRGGAGAPFMDALPIALRDNLSKAGVSRPFSSVHALEAAVAQANAALEEGGRIDPTAWVYRFDDYALSWLANRAAVGVSALHVCHGAIPMLMSYDALHGTSLLETLTVFMRCRYNASVAAQMLFVARSTLLNRLERITELTGIRLDDYDERLYLALSLAMLDASDKVYSTV